MKVVVFREIKGKIQTHALKSWLSLVNLLGFMLDEHETKNTKTITVYRSGDKVTFTIFHSKSEPFLYLDYIRIEPADTELVNIIDILIDKLCLSGEKHIIDDSVHLSVLFNEGKVINNDKNEFNNFENLLLRETIYGLVHLCLDRMIEYKHAGSLEKVEEMKETLSKCQKCLMIINKRITDE
ncbi:hypothetical protein [Bacillus atrophaeus]|uniref:hypothetical protein n=1 Tax=Bacillus atrophaeus TaxID=1452 RepID=UPI002DBD59E3|nr:hypothetical protein [Bacillus atrophaeus]MEC0694962.1 hypothetical protein [Bacillus atrophaeus]